MKLSELIADLQMIQKQSGDRELYYDEYGHHLLVTGLDLYTPLGGYGPDHTKYVAQLLTKDTDGA